MELKEDISTTKNVTELPANDNAEKDNGFIPFGTRIRPKIRNLIGSEASLQDNRKIYELIDDALKMYLVSKGYDESKFI